MFMHDAVITTNSIRILYKKLSLIDPLMCVAIVALSLAILFYVLLLLSLSIVKLRLRFMMMIHSVHLMNVDQHQAAADLQTTPADLPCDSESFPVCCYLLHPPLLLLRKRIIIRCLTEECIRGNVEKLKRIKLTSVF